MRRLPHLRQTIETQDGNSAQSPSGSTCLIRVRLQAPQPKLDSATFMPWMWRFSFAPEHIRYMPLSRSSTTPSRLAINCCATSSNGMDSESHFEVSAHNHRSASFSIAAVHARARLTREFTFRRAAPRARAGDVMACLQRSRASRVRVLVAFLHCSRLQDANPGLRVEHGRQQRGRNGAGRNRSHAPGHHPTERP